MVMGLKKWGGEGKIQTQVFFHKNQDAQDAQDALGPQ